MGAPSVEYVTLTSSASAVNEYEVCDGETYLGNLYRDGDGWRGIVRWETISGRARTRAAVIAWLREQAARERR